MTVFSPVFFPCSFYDKESRIDNQRRMGQGNSTTNPYIPLASMTQDLERLKFSQDLRKNPEDYNAYVSERVDSMTDEILNRKRASFQKAHIDLGRYMDMDHNANLYKTRSADVDRLTEAIAANNVRVKQALDRDRDLSKRQFEINEWYNYNKLETLFFLQVFFISSLCMTIIIYGQKKGMITNMMAGLLTMILVAIIAITGIYRYYYTNRQRDTRLWSRRDFGGLKTPVKKPATCGNDGPVTIDINSIIPKSVTQCADDAVNRADKAFNTWQDNLTSEMTAYQTGNVPPKTEHPLGFVCDNLSKY